MVDLASSIRHLRKQHGFTQVQLAELLGVTFVTISRWENGQSRPNRLALRALSHLVQNLSNPRHDVTNTKQLVIPGFYIKRPSATIPVSNSLTDSKTLELSGEKNTGLTVQAMSANKTETLKMSQLFSDLNKDHRVQLSKIAIERHIKSGEFLYREDDLLEYFYIMAKGRVKILKHSPSGKDMTLKFEGPGTMVGNISLVPGGHHSTSAQCMIDSTVLAIKNSDFISLLFDNPDFGLRIFGRMLTEMSIRLANVIKRLTDLAAEKADYRVTYILFTLSLDFGSILPLTREEVAQMAGIATETAVRVMIHLKNLGVILPGRRKIIILNQAKLGELIN